LAAGRKGTADFPSPTLSRLAPVRKRGVLRDFDCSRRDLGVSCRGRFVSGRATMPTRRDLLRAGTGFAGLALLDLLGRDGFFADAAAPPARRTHHEAKAKHVVFLFMTSA